MVERRLEELASRYRLDAHAIQRLSRLLERLAADPTAPTTVRDPAVAVDVHVADSLAGLEAAPLREAGVVADLGAGAGFPTLALASARPHARFYAVESVSRKAAFIRDVAEAMGLTNVTVVGERAEEWAGQAAASCDAVCARALASLNVLCEYAAPLLRVGGHLVAWKGEVSAEEARDGAHAANVLGFDDIREVEVAPYASSKHRRLVLAQKVADTPAGYPRRPGMAVKRPLRAPA